MKFLDHKTLLDAIQNEINSSQLTFQIVDSSVLSFSMQLPHYLNMPQVKQVQSIQSQINEYELINSILND